MALQAHFGSFNTGTGAAASTVAVTGVGFVPETIFFWWSGRSEGVDTIGRASYNRGFGAAISTTDRRAISNRSTDAAATSAAHRSFANDGLILSTSTVPAIDGSLDLQSLDADGFTLVVDDQMPADFRVHYLALAGDVTNAIGGILTEPGATGTADYTGLGFQPDFVMFLSVGRAVDPSSAQNSASMMIGAATSSTGQAVWSASSNTAVTTSDTAAYCTDGECLAIQEQGSGVVCRADFDSFLADGFRLNWVERNSTRRFFYIALKGGNYKVGNLLTQTDTVTDIVAGSFGFKPSAAMFFSHGQVESTSDAKQDNDRLSIGAFSDLTTRGAQATLDEDNLADTEVTTAIEFDAVYVNIAADSTIAGLMDVKSVDSDGFTMIMDDADPAQAYVWYVAFGPAAAAGGGWGQLLSGKRNRLVMT